MVTRCIFTQIKSVEIVFQTRWRAAVALKSTFSSSGNWHPTTPSPYSCHHRQSFWLTGASRSRDIKDPVVSDAIRGNTLEDVKRSVDSKKGCWIQMVVVDEEKVLVEEEIFSFDNKAVYP